MSIPVLSNIIRQNIGAFQILSDVVDVADGSGNLQGESDYYLPAGNNNDTALVERLGLFVFRSSATDPADGETCIAPVSGGGRWLLICPSWDFIYAYIEGTDFAVLSDAITNYAATIAAHTASISAANISTLRASAALDFPSIAATTGQQTLTITVTGAAVNDAVVLGAPSAFPAGLSCFGWVSSANTVSITLLNNTAGAIDPAVMTWSVTIIKTGV